MKKQRDLLSILVCLKMIVLSSFLPTEHEKSLESKFSTGLSLILSSQIDFARPEKFVAEEDKKPDEKNFRNYQGGDVKWAQRSSRITLILSC